MIATAFEVHISELPKSEQPHFDASDRRALTRGHERRDGEWRAVWDEEAQAVIEKLVPFATPLCASCREPWEKWGCPTVRAATVIGWRDEQLRELARNVDGLKEALSPRFGVSRLREAGNRTIALGMRIDEYTLIEGGMDLVVFTLQKMGNEFRAWFKKRGDRARAQSDHLYALSLDSQYYTYLTQEFNPATDFLKPMNAPWPPATPWDDTPFRRSLSSGETQ